MSKHPIIVTLCASILLSTIYGIVLPITSYAFSARLFTVENEQGIRFSSGLEFVLDVVNYNELTRWNFQFTNQSILRDLKIPCNPTTPTKLFVFFVYFELREV